MSAETPVSFARESEMYAWWERSVLPGDRYRSLCGTSILVVSPGQRNRGAGPDYLGAVLIIDGETRVGPVEHHLREQEWFAHRHHHDRAYDDVILHVLASDEGFSDRLAPIPTLVLEPGTPEPVPHPDGTDSGDARLLLADYSWQRFLTRVSRLFSTEGDALSLPVILPRMFDALGYSTNRGPMREVAMRLVERGAIRERESIGPTEILASVIAESGLPRETKCAMARRFGLDPDRFRHSSSLEKLEDPWDFSVRPGNRPEVRLVAGAVLIHRIANCDLMGTLLEKLQETGASTIRLEQLLTVRGGGRSFLGRARAADMIVNVILPAVAAEGIRARDSGLLLAALRCYRCYPSLSSNRVIAEFSRRFAGGATISGAFRQQGAIEMMQRTGRG